MLCFLLSFTVSEIEGQKKLRGKKKLRGLYYKPDYKVMRPSLDVDNHGDTKTFLLSQNVQMALSSL